MKLNPIKCGVMFLCKKLNNKYTNILGIPITKVYEFLVLKLNYKLKPKFHLDNLFTKNKNYSRVMKILKYQKSPTKYRLELFKVLALSQINYCSFIFTPEFSN